MINPLSSHRYGGKLVYQVSDKFGKIEIVDSAGIRTLHFGSTAKQSAMKLDQPDGLELVYSRSVLLSLIFLSRLDSVLIIGLGGGSLAKFLYKKFPELQIDILEIRETVYRVAREFFFFPDDSRMSVIINDAASYLNSAPIKQYDLIIIDIFDSSGMSKTLQPPDFYHKLKSRLNENGCIALNAWREPKEPYREVVSGMSQYFNNILMLPVPGRLNSILYGIIRIPNDFKQYSLENRVKKLSRFLNIDLLELSGNLMFNVNF